MSGNDNEDNNLSLPGLRGHGVWEGRRFTERARRKQCLQGRVRLCTGQAGEGAPRDAGGTVALPRMD